LKATQALPGNARLVFSYSSEKNRKARWGFNAVAVLLFFLSAAFFLWILFRLRPTLFTPLPGIITSMRWITALLLIGLAVLQLILHELVHGAFFWIFSHQAPAFGFRGWYAFAAAPGWFFPRGQYLTIALAPLILISLFCMLLLASLPAGPALVGILVAASLNAAGSVADLWYALKILAERGPLLVEDLGEGFRIHLLP
jgi:hypothetical protein